MNLKTKAVALVAGSALALSVASGAMATDSSVTLADGTPSCSISGVSATAEFGNYTYNGSNAFVADTGAGTATVVGSVNVSGLWGTPTGNECKLQISGTDLTAGVDSVIAVGNIKFGVTPGTSVTTSAQDVQTGNGAFSVDLNLGSFPSAGITTLDQHNGTLTFSATQAG